MKHTLTASEIQIQALLLSGRVCAALDYHRRRDSLIQVYEANKGSINMNRHLAKEVEDITKSHPMEYLCNHPFLLIRWIEKTAARYSQRRSLRGRAKSWPMSGASAAICSRC